jgi:hypothetical protein
MTCGTHVRSLDRRMHEISYNAVAAEGVLAYVVATVNPFFARKVREERWCMSSLTMDSVTPH